MKEKTLIQNIKIIAWPQDEIKPLTKDAVKINIPDCPNLCEIIGILYIDANTLYRKLTNLSDDKTSKLIDAANKSKRTLQEREEIRIQVNVSFRGKYLYKIEVW